ncbi:MAG: hypothetical protein HY741_12995 [Chloroflexi bacterium]|nr:hypothetical protein [Chloroflexota bacterium]
MRDEQFTKVEEEYFRLRGKLAAGRITREQFDAALKDLMVQDAQGRYWMLGADSGKWFVHDGQAWVEAQPGVPTVEGKPTSMPERAVPRRAPSQPPPVYPPPERIAPRGRVSPIWVLALAVAVFALVVFAGLFIASGLPTTVSQIPPTSVAPTPPPVTPPIGVVQASGTPPPASLAPPSPPVTPPIGVVQATETLPPTAIIVTVLATSAPPKLLAPQEFGTNAENLAAAVADLNRAELKFIHDAQAAALLNPNQRLPGLAFLLFAPDLLDDDLREVAACAMNVAQIATTLGLTMVAQDGGSDAAGQTADQYYSIARLGYALVIEAQDLREGLPAGTVTRADAINTIAEYGARLWNPSVADPGVKGNPFLPNVKDATTVAPVQFLNASAVAQLKTQIGTGKTVQTWLATSSEVVTKTLMLPAPRAPVPNPFDPTLLNTLTTASGQSDADRARQVAAANLAMLTANPTSAPTQIQFAAFKSASIADANQIAAGAVPSFASGKASALARQSVVAEELVSTLYVLDGQAPPRVEGSTPVKETTPLVTLSIAGVKETSRRRDDSGYLGVAFQVQVAWQTTYAAPRLYIVCAGGSSGNIVTSNSGSQQLSAYAYVKSKTLPGEAEIRCEVHSPAGDFTMPNATAWMRVWVEETEKVAITATPTDTVTPTPTRTPTKAATPTTTPTIIPALGTEVAASKTAEFRATITEIARQTAQASQASVFTMNGTFSLNFLPVGWCEVGYDDPIFGTNSVGTIKITVDLKSGAASGSIKGGGSRGTYKMTACDGSWSHDQTSRIDYEGTLSGTVDPATGVLSLLSVANLKYEISVANCWSRDPNVQGPCRPRTGLPDKLPIIITGTVDRAAHTGKGTVTVRNCLVKDHCVGDWHAGE